MHRRQGQGGKEVKMLAHGSEIAKSEEGRFSAGIPTKQESEKNIFRSGEVAP